MVSTPGTSTIGLINAPSVGENDALNQLEEFEIRALTSSDQTFLWEMLYQSLYVPEGQPPFERSILAKPEIARYVGDWGREDDHGFLAVDENDQALGAIWLRLLKGEERGFGYVDDQTPELGMAVLAEHRGQGIGTGLLARLIESLDGRYDQISLSVSVGNPAIHLYQRAGFERAGQSGDSINMKKKIE
jgi:ribosomal protein S18 acetylase RimI-like enzyme